jgi:uncharacterized protein with von Willebrand factor type A (vWA) domain
VADGVAIDGRRLVANVTYFVRLLRRAGLRVGPGAAVDAARAVGAVDATVRDQFYWALHATLIRRHEDHGLFDEAFRLFWRDPGGMQSALSLLLPQMVTPQQRALSRRVSEAWRAPPVAKPAVPSGPERIEIDAFMAPSDLEVLRTRDFDQMSAAELAEARALIRRMDLGLRPIVRRRWRADPIGARIDPAATLRAALRRGGELHDLARRRRIVRPPAIVALCDISGSMGRYSEMVLRFLHVLLADRRRGQVFLAATRLTNVTRLLRHRDVDVALAACGRTVQDWGGGTRLGAMLGEFNRRWSRRVLAEGAVVLLVTDGLERDDPAALAAEAARLRRSCRRLIWLNPLLRFAGFEPLAGGVRALLPNVDDHRPVHDLASLADLAAALERRR